MTSDDTDASRQQELRRLVASEGLEHVNLFEQRPPAVDEIGIVEDGGGWLVYSGDMRAVRRTEKHFADLGEAIVDFTTRARALNDYLSQRDARVAALGEFEPHPTSARRPDLVTGHTEPRPKVRRRSRSTLAGVVMANIFRCVWLPGGWIFRGPDYVHRLRRNRDGTWSISARYNFRFHHQVELSTEAVAARYLSEVLDPAFDNPLIENDDGYFSFEDRYSLGVDRTTGRHYASFPVTIGVADYLEFYELTDELHSRLIADLDLALTFVNECRRHEHDDLLMQKPGWNRGTPD